MGVLSSFFAREGGEFAHKKLPWGFAPGGGGWSGLELTDT